MHLDTCVRTAVVLEGVDIIFHSTVCVHKIIQDDFLIKGLSLFGIPSRRGSGSLTQYSFNLGRERERESSSLNFLHS